MSTHENKETMRRIYEVFSSGKLDELDKYVAHDIDDHSSAPGQGPGLSGLKDLMTQYRSAFSDFRMVVEDQIAEGDKVATRFSAHGRHTGEFFGIPPTGREIHVPGVDIVRFSDGKAVEHWGNEDDVGLLNQLGVDIGSTESRRRAA